MKRSVIARRMFAMVFALVLMSGGTAAAQNYDTTGDSNGNTTENNADSTDGADSPGLAAGDVITIDRSGFEPGSTVQIILIYDDGTERVLAEFIADASGAILGEVTIPDDFDGNGSLVTAGVSSDGAGQVLGAEVVNGEVGDPSSGGSSSIKWLFGAGAAALSAGALFLFLNRLRLRQT